MIYIKLQKTLNRYRHLLALLFLCLTIIVSHTLYVLKTHQFPQEDEHVYLQFAVDMLPILKHPSLNFWDKILATTRFRQPLYPIFISLVLLFTGTTHAYKIALLLNGIFYILSTLATYLLARELINKTAGVFSAYIYALYGFPLFYLHFAYSETAVTTFVIFTLLLLAKSRYFQSRYYTAAFFLSLSIASLVRWVAPIFIIGPFFFTLITLSLNYWKGKQKIDFRSVVIRLIFIAILGLLPALFLYYLPNFGYFKEYIQGNRTYGPHWAPSHLSNPFSRSSLIWYGNVLAQQTIFLFALFIAGLLVSLKNFKKYGFLTTTFIIAYLIFTLGSAWKKDRFIVPIYPVMAIISTIFLVSVKQKLLRIILIMIIVLISTFNFLGATWGIGPMGKQGLKSLLITMPVGHPRRIYLSPVVWPPRKNELNVDLILTTIKKNYNYNKNSKPNLLLTFDFDPLQNALYTISRYQEPELFRLTNLYADNKCLSSIIFERLKEADFILVKTGKIFEEYQPKGRIDLQQSINKVLKSSRISLPDSFIRLTEVFIHFDKSTITVYKKNQAINNEELRSFINLFLKEEKACY